MLDQSCVQHANIFQLLQIIPYTPPNTSLMERGYRLYKLLTNWTCYKITTNVFCYRESLVVKCKSSLIRQKGESQNVCYMKTKHAKISEKRIFLTP